MQNPVEEEIVQRKKRTGRRRAEGRDESSEKLSLPVPHMHIHVVRKSLILAERKRRRKKQVV